MKIELAKNNFEDIIHFFKNNLDANSDAITSKELSCPLGIKAAIRRKEIIVCTENDKIISALRFYIRKREPDTISLYQFAIDLKYRGKNLLQQMLHFTGYKKVEAMCPIKSDFNNYYEKSNWVMKNQNNKYNYWILFL